MNEFDKTPYSREEVEEAFVQNVIEFYNEVSKYEERWTPTWNNWFKFTTYELHGPTCFKSGTFKPLTKEDVSFQNKTMIIKGDDPLAT